MGMLKQPETMGKEREKKHEVLLGGNLIDKPLVMIPWKDSTLHSC